MFLKAKSFVVSFFPWLPRVLLNNETYWKKRTQQYGKRAVLNLAHAESEYDVVTQRQLDLYMPIIKQAINGTEKIALDYGCGAGRFTESIANLISGRAIGIDISKELVSLAARSDYVTYIAIANGAIPNDLKFDVAWVCLVLGGLHDKNLEKITTMVESAIKPGGLLFLVENTSKKPSGNYWHFRSAETYMSRFPSVSLKLATTYEDVGEEISIMLGRKAVC